MKALVGAFNQEKALVGAFLIVPLHRLESGTALTINVQVMERSLHSARACFVENLAPVLTSGEVAVLDSWYRLLDTNPDLDMEVDLVIYLQTSPEVSISRVQSRSRSEEQQVTIRANIFPDPFKYF